MTGLIVSAPQCQPAHLVRLCGLVQYPGIDGGRHQVIGRGDGVDVTRQVKVELGTDNNSPLAKSVGFSPSKHQIKQCHEEISILPLSQNGYERM